MLETIIKAEGIVKSFKSCSIDLVVLNGLQLAVSRGEFLSITGRSGSGKSTLMYQLGLLDRPTAGEIEIENIQVSRLSDQERTKLRLNKLGYVFQDYALLPELSALENVLVPLL